MQIRSAKLSRYFRQHDRAWILSLFAAVCLLYLPFLGSPFVFDDLNLSRVLSFYQHPFPYFDIRWLPYASLGWTVAISSDAVPHLFHLGNALLHASNVILIFYLLRLLMLTLSPESKPSTVTWGSWFGALVFAIHPVAVYAVAYVVQRSMLMATFFGLLMCWAYVRGALSGNRGWLVLSVACYWLACFSKEHSALLPAVLAALALLLREHNRLDKKTIWVVWSAYVIAFVIVVLRVKGMLGGAFGAPDEPMAAQMVVQQGIRADAPDLHWLSAMTQAGLFFKYLFLWLVPNPAWMSVDMREPLITAWTAWQGWLGVVAFIAYAMWALHLLLRGGRKGLLGLALLYPWLLFLIEFSGVRVQEPFVLYRSYLWMPGLLLLFPLLLTILPGRRTLLALGLLALLLLPLAWNRMCTFSDKYRLWNDAALLLPGERVAGAERIYYNRGQAEREQGRWQEAALDFERALAISPQYALMQFELAMVYFKLERYQEAVERLNAAISIEPDSASYYYYKAISLKRLGQYEDARRMMEKSCELKNTLACQWKWPAAQQKHVQEK